MKSYSCAILISLALLAAGCGRTDRQVASEVQNKINADASFPDKQLTVKASNGIVTLSGNVSSEAARVAAGNDAAQIEGVKTVVNNLVVAAPATASAQQPQEQDQAAGNLAPATAPPAIKTAKPSPRTSARSSGSRAAGSPGNGSGDSGWHTFTTPDTTVKSTQPNASPAATADNTADNKAAAAPAPQAPPQPVTIPSGTQLSIRLTSELNSETAQAGDVFRASVATPVKIGEATVIPTTADVEGRVVDVKSAGRFAGQSDLVIELTHLLINGQRYTLATDRWSKAGNSRGKATAAKVGGGAAVGAILGGIFGGGKGAAIGGAVGAGAGTGASAAGKGQQIILKPETVLNFQLQNSIAVVPGSSNHQPLTPASAKN